MNFNFGIIGSIVGLISIITGGTWAFAGMNTKIAVHDTKIAFLEEIAQEQDTKLDKIQETLTAIAAKQGISSPRLSTSTTYYNINK